ncbi:hypothetical protein L596_029915 [Steinernema carpocapsae]|uniref:Uncharacterized protein n=1 Tax=Steinernema carpocapsae TaxID=34508 RepID=A0A4U5LR66_STECR|nr:hypothetical protein L596_029915 [Steinernema carpocapsae]
MASPADTITHVLIKTYSIVPLIGNVFFLAPSKESIPRLLSVTHETPRIFSLFHWSPKPSEDPLVTPKTSQSCATHSAGPGLIATRTSASLIRLCLWLSASTASA